MDIWGYVHTHTDSCRNCYFAEHRRCARLMAGRRPHPPSQDYVSAPFLPTSP